ncbi:hypothetical protein GCM10009715_03250 [Paeniglutamicibacter psychrophenolicus]
MFDVIGHEVIHQPVFGRSNYMCIKFVSPGSNEFSANRIALDHGVRAGILKPPSQTTGYHLRRRRIPFSKVIEEFSQDILAPTEPDSLCPRFQIDEAKPISQSAREKDI